MFPDASEHVSSFPGKLVYTILVVEDEEPIRTFLSEFLVDCGYNVIEAGNVAGAKERLLSRWVDLVFSDVNMPGRETGFDLEKWLRRQYPHMKVLLTSGCPQDISDTWNLREPLLRKPYTFSSLRERIELMLCTRDSLGR